MKKLLSLMLCFTLIFSNILPVFAQDYNFTYTNGISSEEYVEYQDVTETGSY